jgi:phenylpyruvate tautomerase PptA (4-oxalocrotonate tautomerase family)
MPLIEVKLFDFRVNDESSARIIEKLTDALCEATGEPGLAEHTWVIVEGHSPKQWGVAGRPFPAEMVPGGLPGS